VDDVQFIDEQSGENLFVDGGFEGDRIDYDTALAVRKYGKLLNSYGRRIGKPAIWGEAGIRGENLYGDDYKGCHYTEENQQLVDDSAGIYLKKMIWAHVGPENPYMMLWWTDNVVKKGLWGYFKAYDRFMAGIPLSSGNYVDAQAVASVPFMRAWGQKDAVHGRAHLWIDNSKYTWHNIVNGVQVAPISGTVTIAGLPDGQYTVQWWNTSTGSMIQDDTVTSARGRLVLTVRSTQSDIACKVEPLRK
jgi:hypothetical protein